MFSRFHLPSKLWSMSEADIVKTKHSCRRLYHTIINGFNKKSQIAISLKTGTLSVI